MSYADIVFAIVPDAPPTWKNRRATSWPAPISAKVPYFFASRLIWNAFLLVPTSISAFIAVKMWTFGCFSTEGGRFQHAYFLCRPRYLETEPWQARLPMSITVLSCIFGLEGEAK